ncbi:MAG TPA: GPP34 family phosphoprotein [Streptosporangiaceae bacterium]|nr:GPP34 family phosphoprotein [Streptosporangiaceae bacterium]
MTITGGLVARLSGTGRLADDLCLMAHHEIAGKPHLQPRVIGLGLASALLADLMRSGKICVRPDGAMVADVPPGPQ